MSDVQSFVQKKRKTSALSLPPNTGRVVDTGASGKQEVEIFV